MEQARAEIPFSGPRSRTRVYRCERKAVKAARTASPPGRRKRRASRSVSAERLIRLLEAFRRGETETAEILSMFSRDPIENLGFARLDSHRPVRLGYPEAVLCEGKQTEEVLHICRSLAAAGEGFIATRTSRDQLEGLRAEYPLLQFSELGRIAHLPPSDPCTARVLGRVAIVTAGTADLPVAEEARLTAAALGNPVDLYADVGVSGLHRILSIQDALRGASVVIVVAGMDGALPSVVAGLLPVPVIGVPASTGYGAAMGGLAALLAMLTSCAPGLTVMNVDNGYGAACAATRINRLCAPD